MQLVDKSYCDRCGKHTEIVRLIQKDDSGANGPYVVLCRKCLAYIWNSLESEKSSEGEPNSDLNEVKKG